MKEFEDKNILVNEQEASQQSDLGTGLSIRAILIGCLMLFVMAVITYDMRSDGALLGLGFLPVIRVFYYVFPPNVSSLAPMLFVMAIVNPILFWLRKERVFSKRELVVINIVAGMGGILMQSPIGLILYAPILIARDALYSVPRYNEFLSEMSPLGFITDFGVINRIAEGGNPVEWGAWLVPLITWMLFLLSIVIINIGLGVLVRHKWTEREHMRYPVAMFQVSLIKGTVSGLGEEEGRKFWKDPVFWVGFGLIMLIWELPAALGRFFSGVPYIDQGTLSNIRTNFLSGNAILSKARTAGAGVTVYTPVLGIMWFAPLETLFSTWFFGALRFWIAAIAHATGATWSGFATSDANYVRWEGLVAISITMSILQIWYMRKDFAEMFRKAFSGKDAGDADEPMSYKSAFLSVFAGLLFMMFFCLFVLKIRLRWALLFAFLLGVTPICWGRVRAESGIGTQEGMMGRWGDRTARIFGGRAFTRKDAVGVGFLIGFLPGTQFATMATSLEAWKMGDMVGVPRKTVTKAFFISVIAGIVICIIFSLNTLYSRGAEVLLGGHYGTWVANEGVKGLSNRTFLTNTPIDRDATPVLVYRYGFPAIVTGLLMFMRNKFAWWPLTPTGWLVGYGQSHFTFMATVIWIVKFLTMRYGGMKAYRRFTPAFIGISVAGITSSFLVAIMTVMRLFRWI